jgi:hypothetical protein
VLLLAVIEAILLLDSIVMKNKNERCWLRRRVVASGRKGSRFYSGSLLID